MNKGFLVFCLIVCRWTAVVFGVAGGGDSLLRPRLPSQPDSHTFDDFARDFHEKHRDWFAHLPPSDDDDDDDGTHHCAHSVISRKYVVFFVHCLLRGCHKVVC